ncbi:TetR/AcrR family transcriptional regulator [Brevibacillus sp. B_LB10_24]|uniref:TetR/AcrR family transcriptional regulator n=1 Tax=Brevibacillus sp. B_LB10_24 TaxID=3380645 RepID=UPI0038B7A2E4
MRREDRKKQIEETIIQQAVGLFKQKGYDNVTVEEITVHSGIAKGTFFNYFPKKEHVLLHIANTHLQLIGQIVERHSDGPLKERLLSIFRDLLAIYFQHADILRPALVETLKSAIESKNETSNITILQGTLHSLIEDAKQSHSFQSRWDSSKIASISVSLFFHALITGSATMSEGEIYASLRSQMDAVWEGISDA